MGSCTSSQHSSKIFPAPPEERATSPARQLADVAGSTRTTLESLAPPRAITTNSIIHAQPSLGATGDRTTSRALSENPSHSHDDPSAILPTQCSSAHSSGMVGSLQSMDVHEDGNRDETSRSVPHLQRAGSLDAQPRQMTLNNNTRLEVGGAAAAWRSNDEERRSPQHAESRLGFGLSLVPEEDQNDRPEHMSKQALWRANQHRRRNELRYQQWYEQRGDGQPTIKPNEEQLSSGLIVSDAESVSFADAGIQQSAPYVQGAPHAQEAFSAPARRNSVSPRHASSGGSREESSSSSKRRSLGHVQHASFTVSCQRGKALPPPLNLSPRLIHPHRRSPRSPK